MNTLYPELAQIAPQLPDATFLPGITLEWLYNGHIPCFTLTDISRSTVDSWMDLLIRVMTHWPVARPYTVMIDAYSPKMMLTPYVRSKIEELEGINPNLQGRAALILPGTLITHVIRIYLRTVRRQKVVTDLFFNREQGLKWLTDYLSTRSNLP